MDEPQIHSHLTDVLDEGHPLAHEQVSCARCGQLVHAFNNECMTTWVEMRVGNFCIRCFAALPGVETMTLEEEDWLGPKPTVFDGPEARPAG